VTHAYNTERSESLTAEVAKRWLLLKGRSHSYFGGKAPGWAATPVLSYTKTLQFSYRCKLRCENA